MHIRERRRFALNIAYKAASFNAVTLALIVAGVPITDMVIGCTSGMIDDALTLDLTNDEEKGRHKSMLNISYSANHKTIISMDLQSKKLTPEQMEKLIELCSKGCEKIHEEMRGVLSNYIQNS